MGEVRKMKFSKIYKTFRDWVKNKKITLTSYTKSIKHKHALKPDATLSELRITPLNKLLLSAKKWKDLSSTEITERLNSLEVLRLMRKGENLSTSLEQVGVKKSTVLRHLGTVISNKHGKWRVTSFDTIERRMHIYEDGSIKSIVITNSRDASLVGEYFTAVKETVSSNNDSKLKKFENITIIDADGKEHQLETNLEKLYEIEEQKEETEFFEVYDD